MELRAVSPAWLDQGNEMSVQLDLTGARLPPQTLEARLLDGITSVTPRLEYLGYRAWITKRYYEARQPNAYQPFIEFAGRQEAALAIGLAKLGFKGNGVVGSSRASTLAAEETVKLESLAKQKAVTIYGASFEALGLGETTDRGIPRLSDAGHTLASTMETRVSGSRYARTLLQKPNLDVASVDVLAEFAAKVGFEAPEPSERAVLSDVLFGLAGPAIRLPRRDTYAMLLLILRDQRDSDETDFLRASVAPERFPDCLSRTVDGWAEYTALDLTAFAHETGLEAVVTELSRLRADGKRSSLPDDVLTNVVARPEVAELLEELGLPGLGATVADFRRTLSASCDQPTERDGIKRWTSGWAEEDMVEALSDHAGAGGAGPFLAWCCAAQRIADPKRRHFGREDYWTLRGDILPFLAEHADKPVRVAMASALRKVVMQHLRVVWERYANDSSINNALVATEKGRWGFVRDYRAWRMGRRLWTAKEWLKQMGAWGEDGLSDLGASLLERLLRQSKEAT
jgi:hypothetical protein